MVVNYSKLRGSSRSVSWPRNRAVRDPRQLRGAWKYPKGNSYERRLSGSHAWLAACKTAHMEKSTPSYIYQMFIKVVSTYMLYPPPPPVKCCQMLGMKNYTLHE